MLLSAHDGSTLIEVFFPKEDIIFMKNRNSMKYVNRMKHIDTHMKKIPGVLTLNDL